MRNASKRRVLSLVIAACVALPLQAWANADIVIVNVDGPGEGFNDPTPAAPVGGNSGTTIGQQRLIAFQHAANLWGAALDSPVPIRIRAAFDPLTCTSTGAVLGSAGALYGWKNFPNAEFQDVWYHEALANRRAGVDLLPPGDPTDPFNGADINARFNSRLTGTDPGCPASLTWYNGLDNNHGSQVDLVAVLLHEFGHGLGFSSFVSRPSGEWVFRDPVTLVREPGIYDLNIYDNRTAKAWKDMTVAERFASMKNGRNVVWTGTTVTSQVPSVLTAGTPLLRINSPSTIDGVYPVGTASFGPVLNSPGLTGDVVVGLDPSDGFGASTTDGCSAFTNAAAVAGKIALVDRGTCGFTTKVKNAQNAGAIGVLVADNVAGSPPPGLGGADATITIPAVRITQGDGLLIRNEVGVNATLSLDMSVYAGADPAGRVLLNTPDPVVTGSSVSHWDPVTFRNQLMEPAINSDLTHSVDSPEDLTLAQMRDIGWWPDQDLDGVADGDDQCADSVLGGRVVIDSCDSGVENTLLPNGCSIVDTVNACGAAAATHEDFTSCVTQYTNTLKAGIITNKQKASIQRCAAKADIP